jgi:hypothetical protein
MPNDQIDLAQLFTQVGKALATQQSQLNQADSQNHNHGDNMVEIFKLMAQAAQQKQSAGSAAQLQQAAQLVKGVKSGSAGVYARGLEQAATQFQGQNIDAGNIVQLMQVLMGGGQATIGANPGAGALGDLLTQLTGGPAGASGAAESGEINMQDLLNAGLAYMNAKNQGASTSEALIKALVVDSPMASSPHRSQSSELVLKTLLDVVGRMAGK